MSLYKKEVRAAGASEYLESGPRQLYSPAGKHVSCTGILDNSCKDSFKLTIKGPSEKRFKKPLGIGHGDPAETTSHFRYISNVENLPVFSIVART